MIIVNKAILHILDLNSNLTVSSDQELDVQDHSVFIFLTDHLQKSLNDASLKSGSFFEKSTFKTKMTEYLDGNLAFIPFSQFISDSYYTAIAKSDKANSLDLIVCDFQVNDQRQIGILACNNKIGFTHQVSKNNDKIKNEIINHYAILPNPSQKIECAVINTNDFHIRFHDKKVSIDGNDVFILPERVLECSSSISPKETVKLLTSITRTIAENNGQDSVAAISKAKNFLVEKSETLDLIQPLALAKEIFPSSTTLQEEFNQETKKVGIPASISLDSEVTKKVVKNHKIKTDTGIEITFPVDYFQNKDYIEFINNPDGKISIQVKNIGRIINK